MANSGSDGTSLREAIIANNNVPNQEGVDAGISFDPTVFTGGANNRITLTQGQLLIENSVTVDASTLSENLVIDANGQSRVLEVTDSNVPTSLTPR